MTQALRHGSVIAQLENDQFNEDEGDASSRAYRRAWNAAVQDALLWLRMGEQPPLFFWREFDHDTAIDSSYCKGHNAGIRHVQDVIARAQRQQCESADELARKSPVEFGLLELVKNAAPPGSWHPHFDIADEEGQGDA
jgi:hypothetical protein